MKANPFAEAARRWSGEGVPVKEQAELAGIPERAYRELMSPQAPVYLWRVMESVATQALHGAADVLTELNRKAHQIVFPEPDVTTDKPAALVIAEVSRECSEVGTAYARGFDTDGMTLEDLEQLEREAAEAQASIAEAVARGRRLFEARQRAA